MQYSDKCIITDQPIEKWTELKDGVEYTTTYNGKGIKLRFVKDFCISDSHKIALKAMLYRNEWPFIEEAFISKKLIERLFYIEKFPNDDDFEARVIFYLEWVYNKGGKEHKRMCFDAKEYLVAYAHDEDELLRIYKELQVRNFIEETTTNEFVLTLKGIQYMKEILQKKPQKLKDGIPLNSKPKIMVLFDESDKSQGCLLNDYFSNTSSLSLIRMQDGITKDAFMAHGQIINMQAYVGLTAERPVDYIIFIKSKNSNVNNNYGVLLTKAFDAYSITKRYPRLIPIALIDDTEVGGWPQYFNFNASSYDVRILSEREKLTDDITSDWMNYLIDEKENMKIKSKEALLKFLIEEKAKGVNDIIIIKPSKIKERISEDILQMFLEELISDKRIILKKYDGYGDDEFEYEVKLLEENTAREKEGGRVANEVTYVDVSRIQELSKIESDWDVSRLIKLCEELNVASANGSVLSIVALVRSIIHYVPPILGYPNFERVVSQYNGKSINKNLKNLLDSLKHISDNNLHAQANTADSLPNMTQVNFSNDLDVLLQEVCKCLKRKGKSVQSEFDNIDLSGLKFLSRKVNDDRAIEIECEEKITTNKKFLLRVLTTAVNQEFIVYLSIKTDTDDQKWIGFGNPKDLNNVFGSERVFRIGSSEKLKYEIVEDVLNRIRESGLKFKGTPILIDKIRLWGWHGNKMPIKFEYTFKN